MKRKTGFTKRTVVDTRKQLKALKDISPLTFDVKGSSHTHYEVVSKDLFHVHCSDKRGETWAVLEAMRQILIGWDLVPKGFDPSDVLKQRDARDEMQAQETCDKLCDYINANVSCMALSAIPTNHPGMLDKGETLNIDLVRGSNAKILAKFDSWYKCMIYLRGMCEMITAPVVKY